MRMGLRLVAGQAQLTSKWAAPKRQGSPTQSSNDRPWSQQAVGSGLNRR